MTQSHIVNLNDLVRTKVIFMIEREPLSDVFFPMKLTNDQHTQVCNLIDSFFNVEGSSGGRTLVKVDNRFPVTIKNIPDFYTQEEVDKNFERPL